nr:hypothetical protein [Tanacetum cinerariifolium]
MIFILSSTTTKPTMMRQNKNLIYINIDALYNILKENQGDVNDAMGSKKKTVVVTSDPLALIAEKINANNLPRSEFIDALLLEFIEIVVVIKLFSLSLSIVSSILFEILPLSHSSPSYLRTAISNYRVSLGRSLRGTDLVTGAYLEGGTDLEVGTDLAAGTDLEAGIDLVKEAGTDLVTQAGTDLAAGTDLEAGINLVKEAGTDLVTQAGTDLVTLSGPNLCFCQDPI